MNKAYAVQQIKMDAARQWAVVATFRSFNRVIAKYAEKSQAVRRAHDMNKAVA